jgi:glycosyltransferase involved in cell wall biosynthesis
VIHHGVDTAVFRRPAPAERRGARDLVGSGSWIAFLGTLEPRKNVANLVRAFAQLRPGRPDLRLALAGSRGWDAEIDAALDEAGDSIVELGYVAKEVLPGLLGGAEVVAYPSLGEGFGLPVLEAMACGAAVLTTRRLALPEVGGDAVAYCEPDAGSIARELAALLDDPARREELGDRALARAGEFSWENAAHLHVDAYRSAMETR